MGYAIDIVKTAFMITGFVFVIMLVVEYLNVLSSGHWQERLAGHGWGQYVLAAALGATPGCLGAFAVVAMYSHRVVTVGAVVAAMVATSGDESFVMLAMVPRQGLLIMGTLLVLGIGIGALTDVIARRRKTGQLLYCKKLEIHEEPHCVCFPYGQIAKQWKFCSPARGILAFVLAIFLITIITGHIGPPTWNWIRVTLLVASSGALFIVSTVPDHFLEEHLWQHVVIKHVPRIFLWTTGTLTAMHVVTDQLHLAGVITENKWIVLVVACLVGLVPESGPHLVFVTLYSQGTIPLSILLASSIVQDGHGMLPLLAHSRRAFVAVKSVNLAAGLFVGALGLILGGD